VARCNAQRGYARIVVPPIGEKQQGSRNVFDTPSRAVLSSPGQRTRQRRWAPGRVCVPLGVYNRPTPRGLMERIPRSPDEADLPAQEATSRQGTRLSRPDEVHRRAPHPGGSPGPRSEAADGLTAERVRNRSRLLMLSSPQDFAALQERGTMRSHPLLAARILRTDLEMTRFGMATGRTLGSAVVRNRVRRRIRGVLRELEPDIQPGWDVLLVARPAIVGADHEALVMTLRRQLSRGGVLGRSNE
jgi:ribonuclease P protein component